MKAKLIIDTPKSCSECPLQDMEYRVDYTGLWCYPLKEPIRHLTNRIHPRCPLQPTEE